MNKKRYTDCLVLVGSRDRFELDLTIIIIIIILITQAPANPLHFPHASSAGV